MNDWLTKSKDRFHDKIFDFLWHQWNILGVAGTNKPEDDRIFDPEALLLFSLSICRHEPRLFEENRDKLLKNICGEYFKNVLEIAQKGAGKKVASDLKSFFLEIPSIKSLK